ncbi:MAG: hypothetical protein ACREK4_06335, partial [Candidatus Rokuibacteriota bacterium]
VLHTAKIYRGRLRKRLSREAAPELERGRCPRNLSGENSEGAVEAPSGQTLQMGLFQPLPLW